MAAKKGLGRGLGSLISGAETTPVELDGTEKILEVSLDKVEPNPYQPRKSFDEDALNDLAESIKEQGLINPIIVREKGGYYEIIGGERRWRASKLAGKDNIKVIVKNLDDKAVAEIALIDNVQRENLNPIEEALAYKSLIDTYGLKQDEVAERVSKSRSVITNALRLLKLDEKVQQMLVEGMISTTHARAIIGLPEGVSQVDFAEKIFDEKLSVHEVEKLIKQMQKGSKEPASKPKVTTQLEAVYGELEEQLKMALGTKVRINAKSDGKGIIEIEYYSKEQMSELIERLEG